jgi:hypothetical protein
MKKRIILKRVFHRDKWRILISFNYDESLVSLVKQINNCSFSATFKSWYTDDTEESLKQILHLFRDKAEIDISALTKEPENGVANGLRPVDAERNDEDRQVKSLPDQETALAVSKSESTDSEVEMIQPRRIIERVVDRERFSPVEFRINEHDGRLAIKFTGFSSRPFIRQE